MYFWFQTMKANVKQQRSLRKSESEECELFENCPNSELWFLKNVCDIWGSSLPRYFRLGYRVVNLFTQMKLLSISQDSYEVRSFAQGHTVLCNSHKSRFLLYSLKSLWTWDTKKKKKKKSSRLQPAWPTEMRTSFTIFWIKSDSWGESRLLLNWDPQSFCSKRSPEDWSRWE